MTLIFQNHEEDFLKFFVFRKFELYIVRGKVLWKLFDFLNILKIKERIVFVENIRRNMVWIFVWHLLWAYLSTYVIKGIWIITTFEQFYILVWGHSITTWTWFYPVMTYTWTFFTLKVDKNGHFWTTYPPHFVQLVIEGPLELHHPVAKNSPWVR